MIFLSLGNLRINVQTHNTNTYTVTSLVHLGESSEDNTWTLASVSDFMNAKNH